jgi:hypothetical protein
MFLFALALGDSGLIKELTFTASYHYYVHADTQLDFTPLVFLR